MDRHTIRPTPCSRAALTVWDAARVKNGTDLRAPNVLMCKASTTTSTPAKACNNPRPATTSTPVRRLARTTMWPWASRRSATSDPKFPLAPSTAIFMGPG